MVALVFGSRSMSPVVRVPRGKAERTSGLRSFSQDPRMSLEMTDSCHDGVEDDKMSLPVVVFRTLLIGFDDHGFDDQNHLRHKILSLPVPKEQ